RRYRDGKGGAGHYTACVHVENDVLYGLGPATGVQMALHLLVDVLRQFLGYNGVLCLDVGLRTQFRSLRLAISDVCLKMLVASRVCSKTVVASRSWPTPVADGVVNVYSREFLRPETASADSSFLEVGWKAFDEAWKLSREFGFAIHYGSGYSCCPCLAALIWSRSVYKTLPLAGGSTMWLADCFCEDIRNCAFIGLPLVFQGVQYLTCNVRIFPRVGQADENFSSYGFLSHLAGVRSYLSFPSAYSTSICLLNRVELSDI